MFLTNKYTRIYFQLVYKRKISHPLNMNRGDEGIEVHHIIPSSFGGDNSIENLVQFTRGEHYIAHWLLTKMTVGQLKHKMAYAFWMMTSFTKKNKYESSRKAYSYARKLFQDSHPGHHVKTEAVKQKLREIKNKQYLENPEIIKKISRSVKKYSEENKDLILERMKKIPYSVKLENYNRSIKTYYLNFPEKRSELAKKRDAPPERRIQKSIRVSKSSNKEKISSSMTDKWKDPEYRNMMIARRKFSKKTRTDVYESHIFFLKQYLENNSDFCLFKLTEEFNQKFQTTLTPDNIRYRIDNLILKPNPKIKIKASTEFLF